MTATESAIKTDLAPTDIAALLRGYELSLRARNRSPRTITSYLQTVEIFRAFLIAAGMPTAVDRITRELRHGTHLWEVVERYRSGSR